MSEPIKRRNLGDAPHIAEAQDSKKQQRHFTKVIEIGASVALVAALGVEVAKGLVEASGNFGPGQGIIIQVAGGDSNGR